LDAAGLTPTGPTTYVPVDFEATTVAHALADHGFSTREPTAVSWLGVVPYLEVAAVWATLEWAAGVVSPHGHIVFDYGSKPRWWQVGRQVVLRRLAARVAAAGEPFRTLLAPTVVRDRLLAIGFSEILDLDARALNRRYFEARADGLRVGGGGHVVIASHR
jgi:O-methyltransferase involved in polyketide biosynthesis